MKHDLARKLRREQTDAERKLWQALRSRRFQGFKFRRQQPIGPCVVDFVCFDAKLVVELDGEQHGFVENQAHDLERTSRLEQQGYRVKRFWNYQVAKEFDLVLDEIYLALAR